jgi:hypothetical protein
VGREARNHERHADCGYPIFKARHNNSFAKLEILSCVEPHSLECGRME